MKGYINMNKFTLTLTMVICLFSFLGCELFVLDRAKENISIQNVTAQDTGKKSAVVSYDIINNNDLQSMHIAELYIHVTAIIKDIDGKQYIKQDKVILSQYSGNKLPCSTIIETYANPDVSTVSATITSIVY